MKANTPSLCCALLAIVLAIGMKPVHIFGDIQLERRGRSDPSTAVLQENGIEPFEGWHFVVTNQCHNELTVMVEMEVTFGQEEGLNKAIVFTTNLEQLHIGVGLARTSGTRSVERQYEFQLYAFDNIGVKSDSFFTKSICPLAEKSENYIDARQDCDLGKRYVLGEFLITYSSSRAEESGNMRLPDGPIANQNDELVVKLSVSIYGKQKDQNGN